MEGYLGVTVNANNDNKPPNAIRRNADIITFTRPVPFQATQRVRWRRESCDLFTIGRKGTNFPGERC